MKVTATLSTINFEGNLPTLARKIARMVNTTKLAFDLQFEGIDTSLHVQPPIPFETIERWLIANLPGE